MVLLLCTVFLPCSDLVAAVVPVGMFPTSTVITFAGLTNGTVMNGATVSGVTFNYDLGAIVIGGGPGLSNNIDPPALITSGFATALGNLTMLLPYPTTTFGYGFSLASSVTLATGTTISVFDGSTFLGSLGYPSSPDPSFTGGFAGIRSTLPFDRVVATFSGGSLAFAVDNIRIGDTPEPSTILLASSGIVSVCARSRRNARKRPCSQTGNPSG